MRRNYSVLVLGVASIAAAAALAASIEAPAVAATKRYTMAQVRAHKRPTQCWTAINGRVYNVSKWIGLHPGGASVIRGLCGTNGTAAFTAMHGNSTRPAARLARYRIGVLAGAATTPTPSPTASTAGTLGAAVASHNQQTDCWSIVRGQVYDLTGWIGKHPGLPAPIIAMCGIDATVAFSAKHGLTGTEAARLAAFRIGAVTDSATSPTVTPKPVPTEETFTASAVQQHATSADCWVVVNGSVYNLTQWIDRHPGGQQVIVAACGRDASSVFASERDHARATSQSMLATFRIGAFDATSGALATSVTYEH